MLILRIRSVKIAIMLAIVSNTSANNKNNKNGVLSACGELPKGSGMGILVGPSIVFQHSRVQGLLVHLKLQTGGSRPLFTKA